MNTCWLKGEPSWLYQYFYFSTFPPYEMGLQWSIPPPYLAHRKPSVLSIAVNAQLCSACPTFSFLRYAPLRSPRAWLVWCEFFVVAGRGLLEAFEIQASRCTCYTLSKDLLFMRQSDNTIYYHKYVY